MKTRTHATCPYITLFALVTACGGERSSSGDTQSGGSVQSAGDGGDDAGAGASEGVSGFMEGGPTDASGMPSVGVGGSEGPSSGSTGLPGNRSCDAAMAMGEIDGVEPEAHAYHPPVMDAEGQLYRFVESIKSDGNEPRMMKSADGGYTWEEMNRGNRPSPSDLEGCYQVQVPGAIIATVRNNRHVHWLRYNTSDDAEKPDRWVADERVDEDIEGEVEQFSSLALHPNGSFLIAYSDVTNDEDQQRVAYRWREGGGSYGAKIELAGSAFSGPRAIVDSNGAASLLYHDKDNHQLLLRPVPLQGEPGAPLRLDEGGTSDVLSPHTNTVTVIRDGEDMLFVAFSGKDNRLKSVILVDGEVSAKTNLSSGYVLQDAKVVTNEGAIATLATDGKRVHAVWTDDSDGSLRHRAWEDGTWSPERTPCSARCGRTARGRLEGRRDR